jgi:hypothetical protein
MDIDSLFNTRMLSDDEIERAVNELGPVVAELVRQKVGNISFPIVLSGITTYLAAEVVKTHPGCPCGFLDHMANKIGLAAAHYRFHQDVVVMVGMGDHPPHTEPEIR